MGERGRIGGFSRKVCGCDHRSQPLFVFLFPRAVSVHLLFMLAEAQLAGQKAESLSLTPSRDHRPMGLASQEPFRRSMEQNVITDL
jgi:hypothetical protein